MGYYQRSNVLTIIRMWRTIENNKTERGIKHIQETRQLIKKL